MSKKLLIIGDGFIGKNLFYYFKNHCNTTITNRKILDVENEKSIEEYFKNKKFDIIIYAAGFKDVKGCELNEQKAYKVNSYSIKALCKHTNFEKFVYISTDYVFDGVKGNYTEEDLPNPKTIYGKSKLLGEKFVLELGDKAIVARTSGVFGKECTWIKWLNNQLTINNKVECFEDVFNNPTYVLDLSIMIHEVVKSNYYGTINLCGKENFNRYDLFKNYSIVNNFEINNLIKSKNDGTFPSKLTLNNNKFNKMFNYKCLSLMDSFKHLKESCNED